MSGRCRNPDQVQKVRAVCVSNTRVCVFSTRVCVFSTRVCVCCRSPLATALPSEWEQIACCSCLDLYWRSSDSNDLWVKSGYSKRRFSPTLRNLRHVRGHAPFNICLSSTKITTQILYYYFFFFFIDLNLLKDYPVVSTHRSPSKVNRDPLQAS